MNRGTVYDEIPKHTAAHGSSYHPQYTSSTASTIPHTFGVRTDRGIQSDPSGHRGTAVAHLRHGGQRDTFRILDSGTIKEVPALRTGFPVDEPAKTRMCLAMTTSPQTFGGAMGFTATGSTTHLQAIILCDWTFDSASLVDTVTGVLPVGPLFMRYEDDGYTEASPTTNYNISGNMDSPTVCLPWNRDPAVLNTWKPGAHDEIIVHWSKNATARVSRPTITITSTAGNPVTFATATFTFALLTTQHNK